MYNDDYLKQLLQSYGASAAKDCFLLLDERTQEYSVGYLDTTRRSHILFVDDAELEARLVEFLQSQGTSVVRNLTEVRT